MAVALALLASVASGGTPPSKLVYLTFKGSGTYTLHYFISGKQNGGCTEDGGVTYHLRWTERSIYGEGKGGDSVTSGYLSTSVAGPGSFSGKWTVTGGENCSTTEKPTCETYLRLGHPLPMLKFDVSASDGSDTFGFSEPMKLSTTLDCPALVAGLGVIPITPLQPKCGADDRGEALARARSGAERSGAQRVGRQERPSRGRRRLHGRSEHDVRGRREGRVVLAEARLEGHSRARGQESGRLAARSITPSSDVVVCALAVPSMEG